jgi:hypothetical protein
MTMVILARWVIVMRRRARLVTAIRPRPGKGIHTDLLCTERTAHPGACIHTRDIE